MIVLPAGIEPASPPSEGDILSIERRKLRMVITYHNGLILLESGRKFDSMVANGPIVKWYYVSMAWIRCESDSR